MHTLEVTAANVHDVTMTSELLTGQEETVHGDSGYLGAEKRESAIVRNSQIQNQPPSVSAAKTQPQRAVCRKESGAQEILCPCQSGACVRGRQGNFPVSENAIPRSAKTDRQIEHTVCSGKSDSG